MEMRHSRRQVEVFFEAILLKTWLLQEIRLESDP